MGLWSSIVAIAGVVAAPFTGGASLALTAAALVAPKVVDKVVDFVMKPFMGLMGVPDMTMTAAQEAERQQGVTLQRQGSVQQIPVVYGYRKVGNIVTFAETGSSDNKYLWVAHVLSEGMVAGLKNVYIDDNLLPTDVVASLNTGTIVNITSGKYKDRVRLQFFKGLYWEDPTVLDHPVRSTCFFNTDPERPPNWTPDMVYNGLAVIFARYEWKKITTQEEADANPFGAGIPSLSVEMYGKLLSPIRSTAPANEYENDEARYEVITTSAGDVIGYTNPAEVLLDYLRNPRYGKGLRNADIDWPSWYIAAQKCKTEVTYANNIKGPIMNMNFVLDTSQTIFNNVKTILSNFRGYMPYVQGKYKLKIEDAGHPTDILSGAAEIVATFDKNNIIGDIVFTGIERTSKYNQVVVTWVDPDNKWSNQEVVYPEDEADRQAFIALDNGRENKGTFTASGITNPIMAKDIARILFWKSRLSESLSVTVSAQGFELEPGDNIHVYGNALNFDNVVPFRVISTQVNNDMTVTLGCVSNPDYVFPYTRWGEPDIATPIFIPKGAERYYPVITPSEKNGLLPPYPGKSGSSTAGTLAGALEDYITITKIAFVALDNLTLSSSANIYVDVYFTQPNTSLYGGVNIYWKDSASTTATWTLLECPLSPGNGKQIVARFGPVIYGRSYTIKSRVNYQSNQVSTKMATYNFTVSGTSVTPSAPFPGTPTPTPTPVANTRDNFFSSVSARPVLTAGVPQNPRKIAVTLKQDMAAGPNTYLNGLEVFWKPSFFGDYGKWNYVKTTVAGTQGDPISFNLSVGNPIYPGVPGAGGISATADNYDFIFRWTYNDNTVSQFQYHAKNVSVENDGGVYNFDLFTSSNITVNAKELSATYVPTIITAGDVLDTKNLEISPIYKINETGTSGIRLYFYAPVEIEQAYWHGVRVYYHKAGTSGTGTSKDFVLPTYTGGEWYCQIDDISFDEIWEYVVVPLVYFGDSVVETHNAQYLWGLVHNRPADSDYPAGGNWKPVFRNGYDEATALALGRIGTAVPAPPRQDTYLDTFSSATVLTTSLPSSPRKVSFSFKQSVANGVNGHIVSYAVYYKQSDAQYWKRVTYDVMPGYTESPPPTITFNSTQTTPAMDLGYPSYPNFPGRDQFYDFVVRFVYSNGTESTYESVYTNCKIEDNGVVGTPVYNFSPLGTPGAATHSKSVAILTENQAPPGAVMDVRDILKSTSFYPVEMRAMEAPITGNKVRFGFSVPIAQLKSYLAGFRILRREVISGVQTAFTEDNSNVPYKTYNVMINLQQKDIVAALSADTVWNKEYEWAIIPIVWYQGAKVEANDCVYWRGRVNDTANTIGSNPWTDNWFTRTPATIATTLEIRNRLKATFPDTAPTVKMWTITRTNPDYGLAGGDALGYWTLTYRMPTNTTGVTIYRRSCRDWQSTAFGGNGSYYGKANFSGAGRWEKITIAPSSYPPIDRGGYLEQTINLRPAIADAFNDKSESAGYKVYLPRSTTKLSGTNHLYSGQQIAEPGAGSDYPKYWLLGDTTHNSSATGMITQLLIVLTTTSGITTTTSANALRVDLYNEKYVNGVLTRNAPGDPLADCAIVPLVDVEAAMDINALDLSVYGIVPTPTKDASWTTLYRKPSEFINVVSDANIVKPGVAGWAVTYTKPTATPGVI